MATRANTAVVDLRHSRRAARPARRPRGLFTNNCLDKLFVIDNECYIVVKCRGACDVGVEAGGHVTSATGERHGAADAG